MTEAAVPPAPWRIVGDRLEVAESYVPISSPRQLAAMQRLAEGPTPEERKRWGKEAARREAKRRQALASDLARHAVLSHEHLDHRVVSALLEGHGPRLFEVDGKQYAECHGCPTYWEHSEYEASQELHHEWPCPTWTTISEQTNRSA